MVLEEQKSCGVIDLSGKPQVVQSLKSSITFFFDITVFFVPTSETCHPVDIQFFRLDGGVVSLSHWTTS